MVYQNRTRVCFLHSSKIKIIYFSFILYYVLNRAFEMICLVIFFNIFCILNRYSERCKLDFL